MASYRYTSRQSQDKKIIVFAITGWLADELFNTDDLSASAFAHRFIDSYRIPELKVVNFGGSDLWHHESAYGWSVYIYQDKTVKLFKTPTRQFD